MRSRKMLRRGRYSGWLLVWAVSGVFLLWAVRWETTTHWQDVQERLDRVIELLERGEVLEIGGETE